MPYQGSSKNFDEFGDTICMDLKGLFGDIEGQMGNR